jgi:hypothetical protein
MGRRGRTHFGLGVIALLCVLAAASTASADLLWSKPRQLTPPYSAEPQALVDERGQVLLTWGQRKGYGPDRGVFSYRWRAPDGRWSPTRTLPSIRADYETEVALTPRGEAVMAYGDPNGEPQYSIAEPGGEFSKPERLGEPGEEGRVDLAMDDAGNAVAAWLHRPRNGQDGASVRVATRRAGEEFAPARTIETLTPLQVTQSALIGPHASVNDAGAAALVWQAGEAQGPDGYYRRRHRIAYRAPGGSFGAPEDVPQFTNQGAALDQRVELNEAGDAVVSLQEFPSGRSGGVSYAVRSATGEWGAPREVGPLGYVADSFAEPGGGVSFLIQRMAENQATGPDQPQDYRRYVDFATHRPDGGLDGPRQISTVDGYSPDAAMNQRGDILAAWNIGGQEPRDARVAVSERLLGNLFTPELVLSIPGAWGPQVAMNNGRQAAVVWNGDDEPGGDFQPTAFGSFRFDPKLPPLPLPPVIDIGDPLGDPLDDLLDEGGIALPVRCDQACTVRPEGLLLGAGEGARAKKGARVKVSKGKRGRVRVRFSSDAREAAREALAAGRKPWVSVSVRAKGKSPRTVSASRRVKLRR